MPHLSNSVLARRCKDGFTKFTNYKYWYPYQTVLPAALKNEVSRKGDPRGRPPCLQEMSLMLACLKDHEFEENHCSDEIGAFLQCSRKYEQTKGSPVMEIGVDDGVNTRYPSQFLNSILKKYPQPVKKR